jgi:hypothetical protein
LRVRGLITRRKAIGGDVRETVIRVLAAPRPHITNRPGNVRVEVVNVIWALAR